MPLSEPVTVDPIVGVNGDEDAKAAETLHEGDEGGEAVKADSRWPLVASPMSPLEEQSEKPDCKEGEGDDGVKATSHEGDKGDEGVKATETFKLTAEKTAWLFQKTLSDGTQVLCECKDPTIAMFCTQKCDLCGNIKRCRFVDDGIGTYCCYHCWDESEAPWFVTVDLTEDEEVKAKKMFASSEGDESDNKATKTKILHERQATKTKICHERQAPQDVKVLHERHVGAEAEGGKGVNAKKQKTA